MKEGQVSRGRPAPASTASFRGRQPVLTRAPPDQEVSLAIPTLHVQELNNEFNTPLDMVKVMVERHKPYHSADITVEQRAFQVTEKVGPWDRKDAKTSLLYAAPLSPSLTAEVARLTEAPSTSL